MSDNPNHHGVTPAWADLFRFGSHDGLTIAYPSGWYRPRRAHPIPRKTPTKGGPR